MMERKVNLFHLAFISLALIMFLGCGRKEEKKAAQTRSFEEFAENVVGQPQKFAPPAQKPVVEEERPLKIGVIGPQTGEQSEIGRMTVEGVALAAELFNKSGGIGGKPIEYINIDNKGEGGATKDGLKKLIDENVIAIIGSPTGWSTLTPVYAADESRTVFISAGTTRHIGSSGSFSFRVSLPVEKAAEDLLDYCARTRGHKEFFIVTVMEDESLNVAGAFRKGAEKAGVNIKAEGSIFTDDDIPDAVKALKANMPVDGVIFAGNAKTAINFAKQANKSGIRLPLVGGEYLYNKEFLSGGDMIKDSVIYGSFSADDTDQVTAEFVKAFKRKNGSLPEPFAADAYDTFMLLAEAIKRGGSARPEAVRQSLMAIKDFQGVTGTINMDSGREAVRLPYLLKAVKKGDSYAFSIVKSPHKN